MSGHEPGGKNQSTEGSSVGGRPMKAELNGEQLQGANGDGCHGTVKDRPSALRDLVFEALDNAIGNGYGQEVRLDTLENVAINLLDYDADVAEARPAVMDLIPHIEAWRAIDSIMP